MNTDFPRMITLLRKERKLSQKQVAKDLEVSQALLSHYENGIRECGLEFITKCASYYDVSCDYLLGCTPNRSGAKITFEDIPDETVVGKENRFKGSLLPVLNKKLIINSLNIIFDILERIGCKGLINEISMYLMTSIYKSFRTIYSVNNKNPQTMFSIPEQMYSAFVGALQDISETNAKCIVSGKPIQGFKKISEDQKIFLSPNELTSDYPNYSASLYNVIQNVETKVPIKTHTKNIKTRKKEPSK